MKRLFLNIPHLYPKLEICCRQEKVLEYFNNIFAPYISQNEEKDLEYVRLSFYREDFEKLCVEGEGWKEKVDETAFSYLQQYLLKNSYMENGFLCLHGGAISCERGDAIVFLANSMVGKSTLITFLCMNGMEYITDDRVLIDINRMEIFPFESSIMLRKGGKKLLEEEYCIQINTKTYSYKRNEREVFQPPKMRGERVKIRCIYFLERIEGTKIMVSQISQSAVLEALLKMSLSIKDCKKVYDFIKLSNAEIKKISFSNLEDIAKFLKEDQETEKE